MVVGEGGGVAFRERRENEDRVLASKEIWDEDNLALAFKEI
jgi:hypothetical protein